MEKVELAATSSADLSIFGLFMAADPIVKFVMLLLVGASIWCWAIIFDKIMRFRAEKRRSQLFDDAFWSGGSLDQLYDTTGAEPDSAQARVFVAAMREWRRASAKGLTKALRTDLKASLMSRIERSMGLAINREMDKLERGVNFLASIGSVSPFVGLFGTVWGIMNAFQSIAESKNTSLAVVAYNAFASNLEKIGARLESFSTEFSTLLARQLDEGGQ